MCAFAERALRVREHDLHTTVLLAAGRGVIRRYRKRLTQANHLQPIEADAPDLQCRCNRMSAPLGQ